MELSEKQLVRVRQEAAKIKVPIDEAKEPLSPWKVNYALALWQRGVALGVYEMEHLVGCRTLHNFLAVLRRELNGKALPKKLTGSQYAILYGQMKQEDAKRADDYKLRQEGQTKISEFLQ